MPPVVNLNCPAVQFHAFVFRILCPFHVRLAFGGRVARAPSPVVGRRQMSWLGCRRPSFPLPCPWSDERAARVLQWALADVEVPPRRPRPCATRRVIVLVVPVWPVPIVVPRRVEATVAVAAALGFRKLKKAGRVSRWDGLRRAAPVISGFVSVRAGTTQGDQELVGPASPRALKLSGLPGG